MSQDFATVTEVAGDDVSSEQINRLCNRYYWAGPHCEGKDVLELACGSGQGLGYLESKAKSIRAGDIDRKLVALARAHYGSRLPIEVMDAQALPYADKSLDTILLFEAIYYLQEPEKFVSESRRVLRDGGTVLVVSANKDLFDFNPSPYSHKYYGVIELRDLFAEYGFASSFFAKWSSAEISLKQRILRPVKKAVIASGLMPKTMAGKKLLKRLVFGQLLPMPVEIAAGTCQYDPPRPIDSGMADREHKVIYCAARLGS